MSEPGGPDPFGLTADPDGYVPRAATEAALAALVATLREGARPAALIGPPGLGKTLLLQLVGRRLDDRLRSVYLPYAALPLDELCAWALSLLGISQSEDTTGDLMQTASHLLARGSGLLLRIDDASAMPLPTARKLGDLVAASRGALRLLVAASEGPSASRMLAATGANVHIVRLIDPMSEEETRHYVMTRLVRARVPGSVAQRFDAPTLDSVHRLSAGIPRRVHSVASAVLRGGPPESAVDSFDELYEADEDAPLEAAPEPAAPGKEWTIPTLAALRAQSAARAQAQREEGPRGLAVFASALLVAGLAIAAPWLRAAVLPEPEVSAPAPPSEAVSALVASVPIPVIEEPAPPAGAEPAPGVAAIAPAEPAPELAASGTVSVQVNARPWAQIEVDGVDLGATPLAGIPLLAGQHRFRARMPDGRVIERVVDVTPENRSVVFE